MKIDKILVGTRHRKDLGNVAGLAKSIFEIGLLHPIVVTPNCQLIAGERRLEACRQLGWKDVSVTVVDLAEIVKGEFAENTIRKDFLPSEIEAIRRAMSDQVATPVGRPVKTVETFHNKNGKKTRDKIGAFAGVSGRTVEKIAAVVEAAEEDPEVFGDLVEKMDKNGKADGAYKQLKKRKKEKHAASVAMSLPDRSERFDLILSDILDVEIEPESIDCIITDPPYPREFISLYHILAEKAAIWLKPGSSLVAMAGQSYLPEILSALCSEGLSYQWTVAYLTPGGQAAQIFPRKINSFWKPVFWFVKGEYQGDWVGDVARSDVNDNDKRFHDWGQSESGMVDLVGRFSNPGDLVLDPFMGGGTTGAVCMKMDRLFVGVERDPGTFSLAKMRISDAI